jgi:hypothetical protein
VAIEIDPKLKTEITASLATTQELKAQLESHEQASWYLVEVQYTPDSVAEYERKFAEWEQRNATGAVDEGSDGKEKTVGELFWDRLIVPLAPSVGVSLMNLHSRKSELVGMESKTDWDGGGVYAIHERLMYRLHGLAFVGRVVVMHKGKEVFDLAQEIVKERRLERAREYAAEHARDAGNLLQRKKAPTAGL